MSILERHPLGTIHRIPYNEFVGVVIGHYRRLDGEPGVVLQQVETLVVHVSSENWLTPVEGRRNIRPIPSDFMEEPADGERFRIEADGFVGTVIGRYVRTDGKRGVVMQFDGTRILHVYGTKWLVPVDEGNAPDTSGR